jgi:hypothetical protein
VTNLPAWLDGRTPPPPPPLARWLDGVACTGDTLPGALLAGGLSELGKARAAPGRERASAFHLLAADALVTYACEAALEGPDPGEALKGILSRVAARES